MNSTRVDQRKSSTSSIRRSSLIVNLSTTKQRSSITTLLDSNNLTTSTLSGSSSSSLFNHYRHGKNKHSLLFSGSSSNTLPLVSQRSLEAYSYSNNSNNDNISTGRVRYYSPLYHCDETKSNKTLPTNIYMADSPQSAPATFDKPSYCTTKTITTTVYNNNNNNNNNKAFCFEEEKSNQTIGQPKGADNNSQKQSRESLSLEKSPKAKEMLSIDNTTTNNDINHNNNNNHNNHNHKPLQVIIDGDNNNNSDRNQIREIVESVSGSNRTNSIEEEINSPVPIVEVKNTSSSSNNNSNSSSDCEDSHSSRRLIRRRTIRRYHQRATTTTTEKEEGEEKEKEEKVDIVESLEKSGQQENSRKRTTAELTISINKAPSSITATNQQQPKEKLDDTSNSSELVLKQETGEARSLYRTRQLASYYGQQQQQQQKEQAKTLSTSTSSSSSSSSSSSTSSKIAKCSITTNRKQTTSSSSTISEELSSLSKTNRAVESTIETKAASGSVCGEEQKKKESLMASTTTSSLLGKQTISASAGGAGAGENVVCETNMLSSDNNNKSSLLTSSSSRIVRPSQIENLILSDQFKKNNYFDIEPISTKSIQVEEAEESRVHHSESFSSTTSLKRATGGSMLVDSENNKNFTRRAAAATSGVSVKAAGAATTTLSSLSASSSARSEEASSISSARRSTTMLNDGHHQQDHQHHHQLSSSLKSSSSSSSSSRHFKTSSSVLLSAGGGLTGSRGASEQLTDSSMANNNNNNDYCFINSGSLFSSPDVNKLVRELTTDFAELENALSSTSRSLSNSRLCSAGQNQAGISSLSSRLFGRRLLSPIECEQNNTKAICSSNSGNNLFDNDIMTQTPNRQLNNKDDSDCNSFKLKKRLDCDYDYNNLEGKSNTDKINDLLAKAESFNQNNNDQQLNPITKSYTSSSSSTTTLYSPNQYNSQQQNRFDDETNHHPFEQNSLTKHGGRERPTQLLLSDDKKITGVTVSIERIDQKMSNLCEKFNDCNDTKEAIDLLKIMIQMIEKAWSVPLCGDDLGFKLCNSLRAAGGLDIILGFIQDADNLPTITSQNDYEAQSSMLEEGDKNRGALNQLQNSSSSSSPPSSDAKLFKEESKRHQLANNNNPLKLNLSKLNEQRSIQSMPTSPTPTQQQPPASMTNSDNSKMNTHSLDKSRPLVRDSDSDAITSDLGLDSTSVESLSCVPVGLEKILLKDKSLQQETPLPPPPPTTITTTTPASSDNYVNQTVLQYESELEDLKSTNKEPVDNNVNVNVDVDTGEGLDRKTGEAEVEDQEEGELRRRRNEEEETNVRKEELVFLSAKLLSQCLTLDNRDYIVGNGLNPVIKLACNFTTMKSSQSQKLLSRSMIMRQSSTCAKSSKLQNNSSDKLNKSQQQQQQEQESSDIKPNFVVTCNNNKMTKSQPADKNNLKQEKSPPEVAEAAAAAATASASGATEIGGTDVDHSVVHAIIGTEIIQHLFKHSENTCSKMISLGALQAILYACRSSNIETLRHCASALANLALYGGPDIQQTMIEQQAHHWLFPLAFNEDDNVQYYACLAIVVLAANQEIEADVQKSGTLDLVEPFVTLHEPQKFAESTTAHIHGQSAQWLRKLIPLLESKRQEACSLACFHFAMEAYIKKEQGQTRVFEEIGAVEILKKVGCSPIAIISKFSCQALRLIGEKEPHRLSQHVPKWTCEDVVVWVSQIGFGDQYNGAFMQSHVDGDLLLQLDESMLRLDIGIENGIIRRKFLRELSKLKQIADYSSVDKTNLCSLIRSSIGNEFVQYIYLMIQMGVTRNNIHWLDIDKLLIECKITNTIHQLKLAQAIKELQEKLAAQVEADEANELLLADSGRCSLYQDGSNCLNSNSNLNLTSNHHNHHHLIDNHHNHLHLHQKKTLDVFVSYRRSTGSQLASLLKVHLQLRGFSVFIDVERLEAGKFDNNLLDSIKSAKNFILVLSPNALDRCIGDHDCKDWVHKEIVAALGSNCNIIPIMDNFHWPDPEQLPEDMRSITYFNGVRWIHDYQDACVDKVERFIRGELMNNYFLTNNNNNNNSLPPSSSSAISTTGTTNCNSSAQSSLQRTTCGASPSTGSNAYSASTATPALLTGASSAATPSTGTFPPITPRAPFDSDHHPLSFATQNNYHHNHHNHHHHNYHLQQQQQQHSQNTNSNLIAHAATHSPVSIRR